jgi:hypothetical protein
MYQLSDGGLPLVLIVAYRKVYSLENIKDVPMLVLHNQTMPLKLLVVTFHLYK